MYLEHDANDDGHHDEGVGRGEDLGEEELHLRGHGKADDHVDDDRHDVDDEARPVRDLEGRREGSHQHQENGSRSEDGSHHHHHLGKQNCNGNARFDGSQYYLVSDVEDGDVVIDLSDMSVVRKDGEDVGDGRGHPSSPLVVELVEALGTG